MYPYNFKKGQIIQTDAEGISVDRGFIAHIQIPAADAVAANDTAIHTAITLTTSIQNIKTSISDPGVPRNIKVVGNASGIAGNVTIKGTNYNGDSISEVIALNGTTAVEGAKAFKTVTEIDLPVKTNISGDSVSVGYGEKLGLPYKLTHNTVLKTYVDNALEGTAATVTVDNANLENNTIDTNTALSGKVVDIYLIV